MRSAALVSAVLGGAALVVGLVAAPAAAPAANSAPAAFAAFHGSPAHIGSVAAQVSGQRGSFNQNGENWSGVAVTGSGFTEVGATWTQPSATCNSSNDLYAPWVGIDGYGTSSVEQTGVQTDCSSGRAVDSAWYEMYPANPVYYSNTVSAGDSITAKVTRSGTSYTLVETDNTKGWTKTTTKTYRGSNGSAEIILESPTADYPNFGKVTFTGVTINNKSLTSFSPVLLDASSSAGYEDHTSAINSSGGFSVSYEQE
ncbi:MAG TPA: G1 family glutamic endopeptidase [Pseudonocardiaceae bacterium]|nr:G1 family glutamic endopeptidase [Pseudonocardiaceae bacterium]